MIPATEIVLPEFDGLVSQVSRRKASRRELWIMAVDGPFRLGLDTARRDGHRRGKGPDEQRKV
jgi:hypothetical protein